MMAPVYVRGAFAMAARSSLDAWPDGPVTPLDKPDLTLLDRSLRRGLSEVTRLFMHAAYRTLVDAEALDEKPRVVFGSAFGEIATAEAMLAQAFDENSASPIRFRHSVHNTAEGLYSIASGNREPATAIAASWDTVGMALLEAMTQLACKPGHMLVILAEEPIPEALSDEHRHGPLAAGFYLSSEDSPRTRALLHAPRKADARGLVAPFGRENHPLGPAIFLVRAIERGASERIIVGEGPSPLCVDVEPRVRP